MTKTAAFAFAIMSLIIIGLASGEPGWVHAQANVETSVQITSTNPVESTMYSVYIRIEIDPVPPGANDRFTNYTFTLIHPDGYCESMTVRPLGVLISSSGRTDYIATTYPEDFSSSLGNWTIQVNFLGQTFSNGAYYMPSEGQAVFTVIRSSLLDHPPPTPTPFPTVVSNGDIIIQGHPSENVTIISPENRVYNSNNVTVSFFIESKVPPLDCFTGRVLDPFFRYGCYLDYDAQALSLEKPFDIDHWNPHQPGFIPSSSLNLTLSSKGDGWLCNGTLTDLSQGPHHITVWVDEQLDYISYGEFVGSVFSSMPFKVDSVSPNVTILSPAPQTYNISAVPLNFTVNKVFMKAIYSFDGLENISCSGNETMLTELPNGVHNVTVYATDDVGNIGASQTITFAVAVPEVEHSEPVSTVTIAAASASSATVVVAAGLMVYLKKRKH